MSLVSLKLHPSLPVRGTDPRLVGTPDKPLRPAGGRVQVLGVRERSESLVRVREEMAELENTASQDISIIYLPCGDSGVWVPARAPFNG